MKAVRSRWRARTALRLAATVSRAQRAGRPERAMEAADLALAAAARSHDGAALLAAAHALMAVARQNDALRLLDQIPDNATIATWQIANARGLAHRWRGALEDAQRAYEIALTEARRVDAKSGEATVLHNLAGVAHLDGRPEEAVTLARQALGLRRALADDPLGEAKDLGLLGAVLEAAGQLDEAEAALHTAEIGLVRALGNLDLDVAACRHNLALICQRRGDLTGAAAAYRQVLQGKEAALGSNHPELAATLTNLASVLAATGERTEARHLWLRAVGLTSRLALDHPAVTATAQLGEVLGED